MLKPASYSAQRFLADTKIGSDHSERNSFEDMWCSQEKILIQFCGSFELCIHKSFFQADIIFFVGNSYQSLNLMILIE